MESEEEKTVSQIKPQMRMKRVVDQDENFNLLEIQPSPVAISNQLILS
jgi:hypothetical protein